MSAVLEPVAQRHLPPEMTGARALLAGRRLMHHHRLAALVLAVNLFALLDRPALATWSNLAQANLALAILVRQQWWVNGVFRLATSAPVTWPLAVRRTLGKVYHVGGLHKGAALAGTFWFLGFETGLVKRAFEGAAPASSIMIGGLLALVLLIIVGTALPPVRRRRHDLFERAHRFGGWALLLGFWVQAATVRGEPGAPSVLLLLVLTGAVALPWLRLRRVPLEIERPSSHVALARFDYGVTSFVGSTMALSRNPLTEWHSFATVVTPGRAGYRLVISRAGDWTGRFMEDRPSHVWVKGVPTAGVGNIDRLFRRVVFVATGSGLGPILPNLLAKRVPGHLVWATRDPRATYGDELVDEILAAEPGATIWDTGRDGHPDLLELAWAAQRDFAAEAVIVVSNPKVTWQVVEGLERRGVPAYGAIWDS